MFDSARRPKLTSRTCLFPMTLNILATSRHAVYATGDFRLTTGARRHDDLNLQKLIPVIKLGWCGVVAFSGIGRYGSLDVGAWIVQQVRDRQPDEPAMLFVERLKMADKLLERIPEQYRYLTIAMAGFIQRNPFYIVITNCTDDHGKPLLHRLPHLETHIRKPKKPEVRVFGSGADHVSDLDLAPLRQELMRHRPVAFEEELGRLNELVASRDRSVSVPCVVGRMDAAGIGAVRPLNIDASRGYFPDFVRDQMLSVGIVGYELKHDAAGNALPQSWTGTAIRRSGVVGSGAYSISAHAFRNVGSAIMGAKQ